MILWSMWLHSSIVAALDGQRLESGYGTSVHVFLFVVDRILSLMSSVATTTVRCKRNVILRDKNSTVSLADEPEHYPVVTKSGNIYAK